MTQLRWMAAAPVLILALAAGCKSTESGTDVGPVDAPPTPARTDTGDIDKPEESDAPKADAEALLIAADELLDDGEWEKASGAYDAAIEADPNNAWAYLGRGRVLRGLAEPESADANMDDEMMGEAVLDFSTAIEIEPEFADAYYERGYTLKRFGLTYFMEDDAEGEQALSDALDDFARAIELDPEHAEAHLGRARIFEAIHEWGFAIEEFEMILELIPGHVESEEGIERCANELEAEE